MRIIRTQWVRRKKPDKVKCRLVACDVAYSGREDVWAGTPTTIGQRIVLAMVLILGWQLGVGDVKTAFLHATLPPQEQFAVLPPQGYETDPEVVWVTKQALYGYRRAPQLFQEWLAEQLLANGWLRSKLDPCFFKQPITGSLLSHHADDLLVAAAPEHYQNI